MQKPFYIFIFWKAANILPRLSKHRSTKTNYKSKTFAWGLCVLQKYIWKTVSVKLASSKYVFKIYQSNQHSQNFEKTWKKTKLNVSNRFHINIVEIHILSYFFFLNERKYTDPTPPPFWKICNKYISASSCVSCRQHVLVMYKIINRSYSTSRQKKKLFQRTKIVPYLQVNRKKPQQKPKTKKR